MAAKVKAPAWLQRPCGAAFGFGGKLVQFTNTKRQLPTGETATAGSITISQVRCLAAWLESGLPVRCCSLCLQLHYADCGKGSTQAGC